MSHAWQIALPIYTAIDTAYLVKAITIPFRDRKIIYWWLYTKNNWWLCMELMVAVGVVDGIASMMLAVWFSVWYIGSLRSGDFGILVHPERVNGGRRQHLQKYFGVHIINNQDHMATCVPHILSRSWISNSSQNILWGVYIYTPYTANWLIKNSLAPGWCGSNIFK